MYASVSALAREVKPAYASAMLIYSCSDLIFATKIGSTAKSLDVPARPARDAEALANRLSRVDDGRANGPVTGVMLDLEMGDTALNLLKQVKAHDAAIPVVAFGSHVQVDVLHAARQAGADFVLPRSAFTAQLPALVERLAQPTPTKPA